MPKTTAKLSRSNFGAKNVQIKTQCILRALVNVGDIS